MGKLFVIPTPIGNLKDITHRAIETLKEIDLVLAEDTRQTKKLFSEYSIESHLQAYHAHSEKRINQQIVNQLLEGKNIGLVSDAGTPCISDPGNMLIKNCIENGIDVETLPGATAFVPALVNSGFDLTSFIYLGFLPHKKGRQKMILSIKDETKTVVFYESTHRIMKALNQMEELLGGERMISISRELTKKFEENVHGTISEVKQHFETNTTKGEFVVVVKGV